MKSRSDLAMERAKDEMHLAWMDAADAGESYRHIAKRYRVPSSNVSMTMKRIKADLAKSEEA